VCIYGGEETGIKKMGLGMEREEGSGYEFEVERRAVRVGARVTSKYFAVIKTTRRTQHSAAKHRMP
jgi:hypothetical protein